MCPLTEAHVKYESKFVRVRLPKALAKKVDRLAAEQGVGRNEMVTRIVKGSIIAKPPKKRR